MMAATSTKVSGSNASDMDDYPNTLAPVNRNFSMLLSPMEPSSSFATSTDTVPRQNISHWHPDTNEELSYDVHDIVTSGSQKQQRWSIPSTSNTWSRSSIGAEGREASQHSREGISLSTNNSSSHHSSSNYNPGGIWGSGVAYSNDDISKSSHTSTSTLLLNVATATHEEDDFDSSSNLLNHDDIVESTRLFSSFHIGAACFDSNDVSSLNNQPPNQPVRRPSYGTSHNSGATDYLSFVPTNKGHDKNSSQVQYANSSQYFGTSSLQQAANANPYFPRSTASSSSTVPELVGASSESVATALTSTSAPFHPRDSSSSLALAASLGHYDSMYGGPPPPGFIDRPIDLDWQRKQEPRRSLKGTARPDLSPPTLKDHNSNVHLSSFPSASYYNDTNCKDDMLSVTSTTTATTTASLRSFRHQYPQAVEATSSSSAVRALMENTTTSLAEHPTDKRSSFLSLGGSLSEVVPREPSPPILPQPVSEDFLLVIEREIDRDLQRQQALSSSTNVADNGAALSFSRSLDDEFGFLDDDNWSDGTGASRDGTSDDRIAGPAKKSDWLLRMNRKLSDIPVGELDPATVPVSAVMNAWAKTKSAQGAAMVELWLKRAQEEYDTGNRRFVPTTKMYTMAGKSILDMLSTAKNIST